MTAQFTNPLDHVRVAAPCSAGWENMRGNEQVRFCDKCSLNVYNLSSLSKRDAERLVMSAEGRLCVRFYRRADGSILTQNCPVGLHALKRRLSRVGKATVSAVLSFLAGIAGVGVLTSGRGETIGESETTLSQSGTEDFNITVGMTTGMDSSWTTEAELEVVDGRMELAPEPVEKWELGDKGLPVPEKSIENRVR